MLFLDPYRVRTRLLDSEKKSEREKVMAKFIKVIEVRVVENLLTVPAGCVYVWRYRTLQPAVLSCSFDMCMRSMSGMLLF